MCPTHTLDHLLPPARNCVSLRTRGHSYQLPEYSTDLHEKSFLIRCVYTFVKWNSFWFCCFVLYVLLTLLFMFIIWNELSKLSFTSHSTQNRSFQRRLLFDVRLSHLMDIAYIQNIGHTRAQNQLIVLSVSLSCCVLHQNTDKRVRTLRFINFSVRWSSVNVAGCLLWATSM